VSLDAPSGQTVTVGYATSDGTASAGTDYVAAAGSLSFSPGVTTSSVTVNVNGDDLREPDETFFVDLSAPTNAGVADGQGLGTILNDDSWPELSHGQALATDLQAQPGPTPDLDAYRLSQKPSSSYEVLLDATSGGLGAQGPALERIASDGTTILQSSQPAGSGSSRSLRWENQSAGAVDDQTLRVTAPSCSTTCGPQDVYRIRLYETTVSIPRFNNSATQVTVMVVQNLGSDPVTGTIRFWSPAGTLLGSQPLSLTAHATLVLNTAGVAGVGGQSGSITIASDAAYGALAGKAVAVEPATGFTFDTSLGYRPR
jgi:Calx-beta domain